MILSKSEFRPAIVGAPALTRYLFLLPMFRTTTDGVEVISNILVHSDWVCELIHMNLKLTDLSDLLS